jgi:hypothetical protein
MRRTSQQEEEKKKKKSPCFVTKHQAMKTYGGVEV